MALPFYVSPEQMMQDKAEYARKGIAKGKSIIALEYAGGVLIVAENPSASLNKVSELYDRIAFAGAGKYGEFERLRKEGIRYADMKGYAYGREDVTAKSLANAYSVSATSSAWRSSPWRWRSWSSRSARQTAPTNCTASPSTAASPMRRGLPGSGARRKS
jgi:proteasome alpha subunit